MLSPSAQTRPLTRPNAQTPPSSAHSQLTPIVELHHRARTEKTQARSYALVISSRRLTGNDGLEVGSASDTGQNEPVRMSAPNIAPHGPARSVERHIRFMLLTG